MQGSCTIRSRPKVKKPCCKVQNQVSYKKGISVHDSLDVAVNEKSLRFSSSKKTFHVFTKTN